MKLAKTVCDFYVIFKKKNGLAMFCVFISQYAQHICAKTNTMFRLPSFRHLE